MEWMLGGNFIARNCCGSWPTWLMNLNILANIVIALAYFSIPASLGWLWYRRKEVLPKPWILLCFVAFIAGCGITHVCDAIAFWRAPYRLFTMIDIFTALVSIGTAIVLPNVVKYISKIPTPAECQAIISNLNDQIEMRKKLEDNLMNLNERLSERCNKMEDILNRRLWATGVASDIEKLKNHIQEMKLDGRIPETSQQ